MNTALITPALALDRLLAAVLRRTRPSVSPTAAHRLPANSTLWIARPLGRTVRCEAGTLWLTFDGEPQDLILEPGQSLVCAKPSRLGIHALSAARYTID
jgi:hypothetical protein